MFLTYSSFSLAQSAPNYYLIDDVDPSSLLAEDKLLLDQNLDKLHSCSTDSCQISIILNITTQLYDNDLAIKYATWALEKCQANLETTSNPTLKKWYNLSLANANNDLGVIYSNVGQLKKAKSYYKNSLKINTALDHKSGLSADYGNLGAISVYEGDLDKGLENFLRSLKINEELNNINGMAACAINIGALYDMQDQYRKSLTFYFKALELDKINNDSINIAGDLNMIGDSYAKLCLPDSALYYFDRSLAIRKALNTPEGIAEIHRSLADLYKDNGIFDKAEFYAKSAIKLDSSVHEYEYIPYSYAILGQVHFQTNRLSSAIAYGELSKKLSLDNDNTHNTKAAISLLYDAYKTSKDYKKALDNLELLRTIEEDLNSSEIKKSLLTFEADLKEKSDSLIRIEENKANNAIAKRHENEIASEKQQSKLLYIVFFITLILGLVILYRLYISNKQKKLIDAQKKIVENQHVELRDTHKQLGYSLNYAKRLQDAILPSTEAIKARFPQSLLFFQPKDVVSGDFYWFQQVEGITYIAVADCTGHGVPGAMMSVVCSNALTLSLKEFKCSEPSDILNQARDIVTSTFNKEGIEIKDGMDISLCAIKGNKLTYAGALNPLWMIRDIDLITEKQKDVRTTIISENRGLVEFKPNKQPVGYSFHMTPFTQETIELRESDKIYLLSDGFADQFGGPENKKYKRQRFNNLLIGMDSFDFQKQEQKIEKALLDWKNDSFQTDDICILGFTI